ncbi:MAG: alcohol dehydrogenase catalytic domain-containing protein [Solirubrobacteraceae bacterium]
MVRIEATGVCGSDLHIYHGRVKIEPGFTIGHEYVGPCSRQATRCHHMSLEDAPGAWFRARRFVW